jgi:BioD-like phosphotransacetylase family protein
LLQTDKDKEIVENKHRVALDEMKRDKQVLRDFLKQKDDSITELQTNLKFQKVQIDKLTASQD